MHPTPKAIELAQPLKELLTASAVMRSSAALFDPQSSTREFSLIVTEVGMISLLPPIISHLEREGRGLRLKAVPFDSRQLEMRLEAGEADIALGAFPGAAPNLRRQRLFTDPYVSVVRKGHPQLGKLTQADCFLRERHIIVTSSNTWHAAHSLLERTLRSRLDPDGVYVRVPSFVTSAFIASGTDAVSTLPARLADTSPKISTWRSFRRRSRCHASRSVNSGTNGSTTTKATAGSGRRSTRCLCAKADDPASSPEITPADTVARRSSAPDERPM
jgi:DNA-binding transcriptional LysR family regulator